MAKIDDLVDQIIHGDCIAVMKNIPSQSVDLVVTDPPYLVRYQSRDGRGITNDDNGAWLIPAFAEVYRVLKDNTFCVCFFGYYQVDKFLYAWRKAGFRILDHLVWKKNYASSTGMVRRFHEAAYLLGKGSAPRPQTVLPSVLDWKYAGNTLHPTQKPVMVILPLVAHLSQFAPGIHAKPLGLFAFLSSGSFVPAVRSNAKAGNCLASWCVPHFRISAEISNDHDLIHLNPPICCPVVFLAYP